jgi:hypothetical protein
VKSGFLTEKPGVRARAFTSKLVGKLTVQFVFDRYKRKKN